MGLSTPSITCGIPQVPEDAIKKKTMTSLNSDSCLMYIIFMVTKPQNEFLYSSDEVHAKTHSQSDCRNYICTFTSRHDEGQRPSNKKPLMLELRSHFRTKWCKRRRAPRLHSRHVLNDILYLRKRLNEHEGRHTKSIPTLVCRAPPFQTAV